MFRLAISADEPGQGRGDVAVDELRVGDCFNDPVGGQPELLLTVPMVPCDEPHDVEVFHIFELPEGPYPGNGTFALSMFGCGLQFETFVGRLEEGSELTYYPIVPSAVGWESRDDREVICGIFPFDMGKLIGSVEGSGR